MSIFILARPKEYRFVQKLPETHTVRQKKDTVLECMLNESAPYVKWTKNGEQIEVRKSRCQPRVAT